MSGYVPLFSSLTTGTLYGRWPDIGLWPIMLSLSDRFGVVDVTPHYLAGVTGLPVEDVIACMARFCEPDPYSRSKETHGARLELLDAHRDWGWRVVNHAKYREKARKAMAQVDATNSGRDAERKRLERLRDKSGVVQLRPATTGETGVNRLSDSDSDSDSDLDKIQSLERTKSPRMQASRLPSDFALDAKRIAVAVLEGLAPERTFAKFTDYWRAASGANARKLDWEATWRNWCRTEADRIPRQGRAPPRPPRPPRSADELDAEAQHASQ